MGLKSFFENANFTAISKETCLDGSGSMRHKAKIQVNEIGSTAAAATPFLYFRSADFADQGPKLFVCDHPFAYFIVDQKLDEVLFAGVYRGE